MLVILFIISFFLIALSTGLDQIANEMRGRSTATWMELKPEPEAPYYNPAAEGWARV